MTDKLPTTTTLLKAVLEQVAPVTVRPSLNRHYRFAAVFKGVEIGGDGTLLNIIGYGNTAAASIRDLWFRATNLEPPLRLVVDPDTYKRCEYRWDGERWERLR